VRNLSTQTVKLKYYNPTCITSGIEDDKERRKHLANKIKESNLRRWKEGEKGIGEIES